MSFHWFVWPTHFTQVCMFVKISGFGVGSNIILPKGLRLPKKNATDVVFALGRWLSPHPNATVRDADHRPLCPAPFDLNHALWRYTKLTQKRHPFARDYHLTQLDLFPGSDVYSQRVAADRLAFDRYDFIELKSIDHFMNCTIIDDDPSCILETITLPFWYIGSNALVFHNTNINYMSTWLWIISTYFQKCFQTHILSMSTYC